MSRRGWTLGKSRSAMYETAKLAGDVQAVASGDPVKIQRRIVRRLVGRVTGRLLGRLFR